MKAELNLTEQLYNELMRCGEGREIDHLFAVMLASWMTGKGSLPQYMGLSVESFNDMLSTHFKGFHFNDFADAKPAMDDGRLDERDEVLQLMLNHRDGQSDAEAWIAEIVTAACQANDHLWQDLGLWSRKDLSLLMELNFPSLAAKNDKDMKWKKFIYKQLCITEGIYTCRAPSCEVCSDYAVCFGPEE
jgi:nitrogen fixation protein NifQ